MLDLRPNEVLEVRIKENSFRARIAAFNLASPKVAMVWGTTILLFNTSKEEFLADERWVLHELRHVLQARKIGRIRFLIRYFVLALRAGYHEHPYEVDARMHEEDRQILQQVKWV